MPDCCFKTVATAGPAVTDGHDTVHAAPCGILRNRLAFLRHGRVRPGTPVEKVAAGCVARVVPKRCPEATVIDLKNVLVATDFGEASDAAFRYGMELARRFGASLHVLHVAGDLAAYPNPAAGLPLDVGPTQQALEEEARRTLDQLLTEPDRSALGAQLVVLTSARPAQTILSYARDEHIDLIIVGTHGRRGLGYFFLGSVAQQVSRLAQCPVLTVRAHERDFIRPDALQVATNSAVMGM
jgi:nucleotide-binding universal stress UspA family protein